jgi:SOS response regulatory protein OraA/RecX
MRKLSPQQIRTIAYLKGEGIRTIIIARTLQMMAGVALSATYHHVWKLEEVEWKKKKKRIERLMNKGYNTGTIATKLRMDLAEVNKIYLR